MVRRGSIATEAVRHAMPPAMGLPRMLLMRISDPTQIDHPQLREFAVQAAWVAKLEEAVGVLEELVVDLGDDDRPNDVEVWEEDPLEVAWSVVNANFEAADQELEARVVHWLALGSRTLADLLIACPRSLARAAGSGGARTLLVEYGASGPTWRWPTSSKPPKAGSESSIWIDRST